MASLGAPDSSRRALEREPEPLVTGKPLRVRTESISRGGRSLLKPARALVREDGALALERGPVVEVLRNSEEGTEQRWELASKPTGTGDLVVRVELAGLEYVGVTEQGHHYVDPETGLGVRYGKATWVDAEGVKTPVEPVREGGALVMRVPARVLEDSAWPAVLDPIISPEISPDTPVPAPASGSESSPVVAYGGGIYLVAWSFTTYTEYDIQATRVRASDGVVLDVSGISLATATGNQLVPAVASNGSDFLVAWVDSPGFGSSSIRGARVRGSDGKVLDSASLGISTAASSRFSPAIASDGTNYFVVWDDTRSYSYSDIYGTRVRASDGAVLDSSGIPISTATYGQSSPAIAFDGSKYLVVWSDSRSNSSSDIYGARVSAAGTVLDTSGIPISTAANSQGSPTIAFAGGHFLVAWDDYRNGSTSDVYAARVRASDAVVLDPSGTPIATGSGSQGAVSAATDGSQFLLVWQYSTGSSSYDVHGARVGVDGVVLDTPGAILFASATDYERVPAVAFDGSHFLVVWEGYQSSRYDIYGARVRPSDLTILDTPGRMLSTQANAEGSPAVAGGRDSYLVVWQDTRDLNGRYDVYGVRVRASDGTVLDPAGIPIGTATNSQASPAVAFDGSNFLVVWNDYRSSGTSGSDIYGARVRESDGAVLDAAGIPISTASRDQWPPAVTFGDGYYFVTWHDYRNGSTADVYGARVRASDGVVLEPQGIAVTIAAQDQQYVSTAFGDGHFLVVWSDSRNTSTSNMDIYGARIRASDGVVLDSAGIALSTASGNQYFPDVAFDGSNFLTIWQDLRNSSGADIYGARVRPSDGAVLDGTNLPLCTDASYQGMPALAFDGSTYLMVWRDTRNGVSRLNGSRVKPDGTVLDGTGFLIADMTANTSSTTVPAVASWGKGRFLAAYEPYDAVARQLRVKVRLVGDPVNGSKCASGAECTSGYCVDGVCCNTSCADGTCGSGTCEPLPGPDITCPENAEAEATGADGAIVDYPSATATGTAPLSFTYSQDSGTRFALGTNTVTATVKDGLGRTDTCSFTVTVRDTTAPTPRCGVDLVAEATEPDGAAVSYAQPTASDAITSAPDVSVSHASGSRFPLGVTRVLVTAKDEAGNSATCSFTITVRDTTAPTLSCPTNVTAEASGPEGVTVNYPSATAEDAASSTTLRYSQAAGTLFGLGTTDVTVTATDGANNTTSCVFTVAVRDSTPPTLACGADLEAEATGPDGASVDFTLPTATDAVSATPVLTASHEPGALFPPGPTRVTVKATDVAGNASECTFTVTVRDTTAPEVGCPGNLTAEAQDATGAPVAISVPAPRDTVTRSPTVSSSHAPGSRFPLGTTEVVVSASDEAGNSASCAFTVTVQDTTAPTLSCPADLAVRMTGASSQGIPVEYPAATTSDAVSTPVLSYSRATGELFPLGTTPVTVTATDAAGNSATCTFQVKVDQSIAVQVPAAQGCGCAAGSGTPEGLGWGALLLLSWSVSRRRIAPRV
ncbi:HYR domain-containing protein [Archangium lipolyticum]|uniref:HYR domain-containing protein n=1 Tax=Archangium lipolyticum TaxID=2970465 RepID=UPI002149CF5F|nr:HYR domain-containing protein [Archangium lipolyticum]